MIRWLFLPALYLRQRQQNQKKQETADRVGLKYGD